MKNIYGQWCLLAGAAEGLGKAFAISLAERGMDIIMVDHQEDLMQALADQLEQKYGIRTRRIHLDLALEGSTDRIMDAVKDTFCRLLIYTAAFSRISKFQDHTPEDLDRYIEVNARTPVQLVHGLVALHKSKPGQKTGIILMASLAGLWGSRYLAPYGATKAYNIVLAEALHHELKSQGIDVMACVAGATSTPAYLGTHPQYGRIRPPLMPPRTVVEAALGSLGRRALFIPGRRNRINYFLMTRILSRKITSRLFNQTTRKMYPDV